MEIVDLAYRIALTLLVLALVALVAVVAVGAAGLLRSRRHSPRLRVRDSRELYRGLAVHLRSATLPAREAKQVRSTERRERRRRSREAEPRPGRVFVLDFDGDPQASGAERLREEVTAVLAVATQDDEVVLRMENSGGAVTDHGFAASQLLRFRRQGVRLTVAVDRVAASGGYMMACVADRIVAAPFAVVGSIGVIATVPNVRRLLDRYGVTVEDYTAGRWKRTVTPYGENGPEEREKLGTQLADLHALFKQWVGEHRPHLDLEQVGTGEYWYGPQALELGLIDEIVTSDDYLAAARARGPVFEVRYRMPRRRVRRLLSAAAGTLERLWVPAAP